MGTLNRLVRSKLTGQVLFNRVRQSTKRTLLQVYRNPEAVTDELVDLLYAPACDPGAQVFCRSSECASWSDHS